MVSNLILIFTAITSFHKNINVCVNYMNIMANYQLFSCINGITRNVNDSNSNIDLIFVKNVLSDTIRS